jgi:DNA invertase Pin-like site-specific DNA recombinase
MGNVVVYLRVSSLEQGRSGFAIEAQRYAVEQFCAARTWPICREYVEVETARRDHMRNRPQLAAALAYAKRLKLKIVVARLDRLTRSLLVMSQFLAAGVDFVAADDPDASRLVIQCKAMMAEYESRIISERTKEGMRAARARGVSFQRHHWCFTPEVRLKAAINSRRAHLERAREAYADIAPAAIALRESGKDWVTIARYLNDCGHVTLTGSPWSKPTVKRLVRREAEMRIDQHELVLKNFCEVSGGSGLKAKPASPTPTPGNPPNAAATQNVRSKAIAPIGVSARAIVYCRVSSQKQNELGHSLAVQQEITQRFCAQNNLTVIETYIEVERAWRTRIDQRPQLVQAIAHAKATASKIIISRLDRLARNVSVVTGLIESGVPFVAADAPFANHFTLHLLSAAAQEESRLISARMKDVRAEAKASGRVWKHVCNFSKDRTETNRLGTETRLRRIRERYAYVEPIAKRLRESGLTMAQIAVHLNEKRLSTRSGTPWTDQTILSLLRRIGAAPPPRNQRKRRRS